MKFPKDDFINAMSFLEFKEWLNDPESHHEEFYKDLQRIFSDSVSKSRLDGLKEGFGSAIEEAAMVADKYPQRDPAEDGSGYWAAEEIASSIRELKKK